MRRQCSSVQQPERRDADFILYTTAQPELPRIQAVLRREQSEIMSTFGPSGQLV